MPLSTRFEPYVRTFYHDKIPYLLIGDYSYMVGTDVFTASDETCSLIGKFCSMARGIKFSISENHDYRLVSSYPFGLTMFRSYLPKSIPPPSNTVARWKKLHRQSQTNCDR